MTDPTQIDPSPRDVAIDEACLDLLAENRTQVADALDRLNIDPQKLLRAPWDAVHDVVGPIWPHDLWAICAGTGNGKTATGAHFVDDWVSQKKRIYFISLEQKPSEHRTALAALRLGLHPMWCLQNDWDKLGRHGRSLLEEELARQKNEGREYLMFSDTRNLSLDTIDTEFVKADRLRANVIVLDHLNKVQSKSYQEFDQFMDRMKWLANDSSIPVLNLVQLSARKEGDPIAPYLPPNPYHIKGGEVIRENMSVAIGLYRPLLETFSRDEEREVRRGIRSIRDFIEPNTIGMLVMKHRLRGETTGSIIKLPYQKGRIRCPATEDRRLYEMREDI